MSTREGMDKGRIRRNMVGCSPNRPQNLFCYRIVSMRKSSKRFKRSRTLGPLRVRVRSHTVVVSPIFKTLNLFFLKRQQTSRVCKWIVKGIPEKNVKTSREVLTSLPSRLTKPTRTPISSPTRSWTKRCTQLLRSSVRP